MVPELHDVRIICLLEAVTPAWTTNTVSFIIAIDCIHYSGSFDILQARVKCLLSVGPARPVPRALNITPRVEGRSMYLSCILLRVAR